MAERWLTQLAGTFGVATAGRTPIELVHALCREAPRVVSVTGVAVSLQEASGVSAVVFASNDVARQLEDLQTTLGEGPGIDSFTDHGPLLVAELETSPRWHGFTHDALALGVRAVFGFPLQLGAIKIGSFTMHRDRSGRIANDDLQLTFELVEALTHLLLHGDADSRWSLEEFEPDWTVIHQATGMVSVQLSSSLEDALARLRAYAYAHDRRIGDVARAIVERRLRLGDGGGRQW